MSEWYADFEHSGVISRMEEDAGIKIVNELSVFLREQSAGEFTSLAAVIRQAQLFLQEKKEEGIIFSFSQPQAVTAENGTACTLTLDFVLPSRGDKITVSAELEAGEWTK